MMKNFTFGNHLGVSLGIQVSKSNRRLALLNIIFTNTGPKDFVIEPSANLRVFACGGPFLVSGPFLTEMNCDNCDHTIRQYITLGQGLMPLLKLKAGTHIEELYNIGWCDFSSAKSGLYTTDYAALFFRHNITICKIRPDLGEDRCYNDKPSLAEEEYDVPIKLDFEIPEELSGYTWYTDIYSMALYSLPVVALAGAAYKMYHHHHADKSMHDV